MHRQTGEALQDMNPDSEKSNLMLEDVGEEDEGCLEFEDVVDQTMALPDLHPMLPTEAGAVVQR